MINNKEELIKELKKNNKIFIDKSLLSINYVNFYENDIRMIYTDSNWEDLEEKQIEFCDAFGFLINMVYLNDLVEFEQVKIY